MMETARKWSSNYPPNGVKKRPSIDGIFRWSVWIFKACSSRHATHDKARSEERLFPEKKVLFNGFTKLISTV